MSTLAEQTNDFGYYPRTMITLDVIAYNSMGSIRGEVESQAPGWCVTWGPAELVDLFGVSYSRAFIARRAATNEYALVIRGTDPESLEAWLEEDFDVSTTVPFTRLAPDSGNSGQISTGACNGVNDLLQLTDPDTGVGIVDYLRQVNPPYLYVTGHSLGGTLTPPMFAYLYAVLNHDALRVSMAPFSFAGLTAGDAEFNAFYNGLFNPEFPWRFHNTLDIAPFLFYSLEAVQDIYRPWNVRWSFPESDLIPHLFHEAAPHGYQQPVGDWPLAGVYETDPGFFRWADQAVHQHHGTTYQALVTALFPPATTQFVNFKGILQPEPAAG